MKIVIFSINPIFPDVVTGGASKHLFHIAGNLGSEGHAVDILCAQSNDSKTPFVWWENVTVLPVLPFHLPFPQPYAISAADLAYLIEQVSAALSDADRFYIHDGEFLVPDVYESLPTITSFRDNIYPESVLGTFIGKADDVICVSDFSADVIKSTAGRFFPNLKKRMHQINNGIDFDVFKPVDTRKIAKDLGVNTREDKILLHPHRPEPGKGFPETIQTVNNLVHEQGITNLKVLVPEWIGEMVSAGDSVFYNSMMRLMRDLGVREYFRFIPWLPIARMPELYSIGDVTLCLGNIVEAFGNVAYESLACGTHSIVARVGVHRTLMPEDLIDKINYGDIQSAVDRILAIFKGDKPVSSNTINYLRENLNFEHQVKAYADIIVWSKKRERLEFSYHDDRPDQPFALAPWCYLDGDRIYHDFKGEFSQAGQLAELLHIKSVFTQADALNSGVSESIWVSWKKRTWVVPLND